MIFLKTLVYSIKNAKSTPHAGTGLLAIRASSVGGHLSHAPTQLRTHARTHDTNTKRNRNQFPDEFPLISDMFDISCIRFNNLFAYSTEIFLNHIFNAPCIILRKSPLSRCCGWQSSPPDGTQLPSLRQLLTLVAVVGVRGAAFRRETTTAIRNSEMGGFCEV